MNARSLARFLGWFSVGLGAVELVAPGALGRRLGLQDDKGLVRFYGVRELAAGLGILGSERTKPAFVWSRVAGDAIDLATLVTRIRRDNPKRAGAAIAAGLVAGIGVLDVVCGRQLRSA